MNPIAQLSFLFVDDEPSVLNSLRRFLRKEQYQTLFTGSGKEALEILRSQEVHILVTDLRMPEMSGLELILEAKKLVPQTIRIILSASRDVEQAIASINSGEVFRFIPKPLDPEPFKGILLDAAEYYLLTTERTELLEELAARNHELEKVNQDLQSMADALQVSENKFRTIMEMANDAVIMTDEKLELVFWNKAAEDIFGYLADEVIGKNPYHFLVPEQYREKYEKIHEETVRQAGGQSLTGIVYDGITVHKNGKEIPVELCGSIAQIDGKPYLISVLRDVSQRVAAENVRKRFECMQRNLESRIEKSLLQAEVPADIEQADIAVLSIASKHLDGDFTDFVSNGKGKFDLLTADVMGKGVQAALVGAGVKSCFLKTLAQWDCAITPRPNCPCPGGISDAQYLGEVVANVHAMTVNNLIDLEMFVTLCFSRFNLGEKTMAFVNCGHTHPIHYQVATDTCTTLAGENMPLGMVETARYRAQLVSFASGDVFLFYSDGISEAERESGEQFGIKRLAGILQSNHQQAAEQLVNTVKEEVRRFSGSDHFSDDFTCIVVKVE